MPIATTASVQCARRTSVCKKRVIQTKTVAATKTATGNAKEMHFHWKSMKKKNQRHSFTVLENVLFRLEKEF